MRICFQSCWDTSNQTVSTRLPLSSQINRLWRKLGSSPVEYILYDLWEEMRVVDEPLANTVLESTFIFMRAQTDKVRLSMTKLGVYLDYREKDVGKA